MTINCMIKGRKPQEFLSGERIYFVNKAKNGRGDLYGLCYLPKELIGEKITIKVLDRKDYKFIEVVKRKYLQRKIELKGGKKNGRK